MFPNPRSIRSLPVIRSLLLAVSGLCALILLMGGNGTLSAAPASNPPATAPATAAPQDEPVVPDEPGSVWAPDPQRVAGLDAEVDVKGYTFRPPANFVHKIRNGADMWSSQRPRADISIVVLPRPDQNFHPAVDTVRHTGKTLPMAAVHVAGATQEIGTIGGIPFVKARIPNTRGFFLAGYEGKNLIVMSVVALDDETFALCETAVRTLHKGEAAAPRAAATADREKALEAWLKEHGGGAVRRGAYDEPGIQNPSKPIFFVSLSRSNATDADVATLVKMLRELKTVKAVNLPHAATNASLKELATLDSVEEIDSEATQITDEGMKYPKNAKGLRRLSVVRSMITDKGIEQLKDVTWLEKLDVDHTPVTDRCLPYLTGMTNLKILWASNTDITDAGLEAISRLSQLEELTLCTTRVTFSGVAKLSRLKKLKDLDLIDTAVTARQVQALKKILRNVNIEGSG